METRGVYTPILKGSLGELKALGRMPMAFTDRVRPLVEFLSAEEGETLEDRAVGFGQYLRKHCPFHVPSVDLHAIAPDELIQDGLPALEALCAYLRGIGVQFVPVFGFDHEPELWPRVAAIAEKEGRGLTFRLRVEDLETADDTLDGILDRLGYSRLSAASTDLLLDLGSLADLDVVQLSKLRDRTQDFIESAVTARRFRRISVVGSSMPKDVSEVPRGGVDSVERAELHLWVDAVSSLGTVNVGFGDYGVVHPNFSMRNPAPNANAKIRYTKGRHHHIFRGDSLKKLGYEQFHDLAKRVVNADCFVASGYSRGDNYVWRCSRHEVGTGSLSTWVEVDMNHHMVYVADHLPQILQQLALGATIPEALTAA